MKTAENRHTFTFDRRTGRRIAFQQRICYRKNSRSSRRFPRAARGKTPYGGDLS